MKKILDSTCSKVLNKHVPWKKRYTRGSQRPFMNKHISKEIMERSKLRNNFLKTKNNTDKFNYNKQLNFCVSLIRKKKSKYFANQNIKDIADNKKCWKIIKPCFSDKSKNSERIVLNENDEVVMEDDKVALTLNTFFSNIVTSLNIPKFKNCNLLSERILQPTLRATLKFANHLSISAIKKYNRTRHQFFFSAFEKEDTN